MTAKRRRNKLPRLDLDLVVHALDAFHAFGEMLGAAFLLVVFHKSLPQNDSTGDGDLDAASAANQLVAGQFHHHEVMNSTVRFRRVRRLLSEDGGESEDQ